MTSRFLFALVILVIYLEPTPAKKMEECLKDARMARRNQSENFVFLWKDDIPLKLVSPFQDAVAGNLNETLQTMKDVLYEVLICNYDSNPNEEQFLLASKSSSGNWVKHTVVYYPALVVFFEAIQISKQAEELGTDGLKKLADCLKGLEAGEKNWMKDTCPDYDYTISSNLTNLEGSCRKDSQNLKCVLDNLTLKCGKFIADVYVLKNRVTYTLLELHHNETKGKDEEYPEKCHLLAMGSGVLGRNPRGNMSTWTLIFLALLSWAIQSAVGMIEKFGS